MALNKKDGGGGASLARVQALVGADGIRPLKRFAEALRDFARADGSRPLLPESADIEHVPIGSSAVPLARVSVYVPSHSVDKARAYARILRNAARGGGPPPKFRLSAKAIEIEPAPALPPQPEGVVINTTVTIDPARIREGMRAALEARNG